MAAGVGLAIERLRDRGRPANVNKKQDFNLEVAALVGDVQRIPDADFASRLDQLKAERNPSL